MRSKNKKANGTVMHDGPSRTASDRELTITRITDASRERVFKAWTDPEPLKHMVRALA